MRSERKEIEFEIKSMAGMINSHRRTTKLEKTADQPPSNIPTSSQSKANVRHHIIISGTGRAGTTFLVELLTALGLDTGFNHFSTLINKESQAGLEWDIRRVDAPYIVKNPALCDQLAGVLEEKAAIIDWAVLPIRKLSSAANSRARVSGADSSPEKKVPGGFWEATNASRQKEVLGQKLSELIVTLTQHDVPIILPAFPRLVDDAPYLYEKLEPILADIDFETFSQVHRTVARPSLVGRDL